MLNFRFMRAALVAAAFTAVTLPSGASPHLMKGLEPNSAAGIVFVVAFEPIDASSTATA